MGSSEETLVSNAFPRTQAETNAGFTDATLFLVYPPGDVRRYRIVPNDTMARMSNTAALKQLVSPLGTSTFSGNIIFPNTTGADVYNFNDIIALRDGIHIDLDGCEINFTKSVAEAADDYAGFFYAVREFSLRNGSIVVDYNGTGRVNAGAVIRIGNRKNDGIYFPDSFDSLMPVPQGNVVLRDLRLTSNNPTNKIIEMTGGLRNVVFENISMDGQSLAPVGIYYEFGFATDEPLLHDRQSSHPHNMQFRNIEVLNLNSADVTSVGVGLTGAYDWTIDGLYVNGARSVFQGTPGESLFYRPWANVDTAAQHAVVLRNVVGLNIVSTAMALSGAVVASGYLAPLGLGDADETDLADYVVDGFSLSQINSVGIQSSARTLVLRNGSITGGTNPIILTDDSTRFLISNVTARNSSSVGFRLNFGAGLWPAPRQKVGRIVDCMIAGCQASPAIAINNCVGCVIESCRFGYELTHDGISETTQLHAVSVGAAGSNVVCRGNHVNVASGTGYVIAGAGPRGCVIENASGTSTATGIWEGVTGTWTGALTCGTSGTISAGINTGRYVKSGKLVTATIYLDSITVSSPVGTLTLSGLPIANGSTLDSRVAVSLHGLSLGASATGLSAQMAQGSTSFQIFTRFSGGTWSSNASDIRNGSILVVSVTYITD